MCMICGLGLSRISPKEDKEDEIIQALGWMVDEPQGIVGSPLPNVVETTDAAGSTATAYSLALNQIAAGSVGSAGDRDWYAVNLTAGTAYTVALVGTETNNLQDPLLRLIGTDGTTIVSSNDNGLQSSNSVLTYTPVATGTYYVDAGSASGTATGSYRASLVAGTKAFFDHEMGAGVIDSDWSWSSTAGTATTVTYGFRAGTPGYTPGGRDLSTVTQLTQAQIDAVRLALGSISDVANITFTEVNPGGYTDDASMLFNNYYSTTDGSGAFAYYPWPTARDASYSHGDVWLNTQSVSTTSLNFGSYSYQTLVHEIGHAVGLAHPGLYNAAPGVSITYDNNAQFAQDTRQYSTMSYFSHTFSGGVGADRPETPMLLDVMALQHIYGANTTTRAGDTIYGFNNAVPGMAHAGAAYNFATNNTPHFVIWDGGGRDRIDASGCTVAQTITLVAGQFSSMSTSGNSRNNIAIAYGATIEDAIGGSASDTITGNAVGNNLAGLSGNDTIDGGDGNDTMGGHDGDDRLWTGLGDDIAWGDAGADQLGGLDGNDTLFGGLSNDTIWGDAGNDLIFGNEDFDNLSGFAGNDTLEGGDGNDTMGGHDGDDRLWAGLGDDIAWGDAGADQLGGLDGNDTLSGGLNDDTIWGDDGNDLIFGNEDQDNLSGFAGNDTLEGGDGNDTMGGHDGDDRLWAGAGADIVWGDGGFDQLGGHEGNDTLFGGLNNDTIWGDEGDDLILGGEDLDDLSGGAGNDTLDGGAGNDTMGGQAGDDRLWGGTGADIAWGDDGADHLGGHDGNDTLFGGAGNDLIWGDADDDQLFGGDNDDLLQGGAGNDTLNGEAGNDTFVYLGNDGADRLDGFAGGAGAGDVIRVLGLTAFDSFAEIQAAASVVGGILQINLTGSSVQMIGFTSIGQLAADDFLFV